MRGTIKSATEISTFFNFAKKINTRCLIAYIKPSGKRDRQGRVAFIAGKKLGPAPTRSRCKRLMREAARKQDITHLGYDMVLISKKEMLSSEFLQVCQDIETIKKKLICERV